MALGSQKIGIEGFTLTEVDRDIDYVNPLFEGTLGPEYTPQRLAIDTVRAAGRAAIGDIGCDTGNTLSTLAQTLKILVPCDEDQITSVGVTLRDYSQYRDERAAAAWEKPGYSYYVRDITRGVPEIIDNSLDVAFSYASIFYS